MSPRTPVGRIVVAGVALGAALATMTPAVAAPAPAQPGGGYIVTLHNTIDNVWATAVAQTARHGSRPGHVYRHALKGYSATLTAAAAAALSKDPSVAAVQPDGEVRIAAQTIPTGIDRVDAELSSIIAGDGSGTVNADVAVIDTGVGPHPDLTVAGGTNCVIPGGSFNDDNGHGTHVAGTIAAKDDANGVVGVAPGARIWSVKVLNAAGSGSFAGVICGIDWVTARAATIEVASMSFSGGGANDTCAAGGLHAAICRMAISGVTPVAAAGDSRTDTNAVVPATYNEVLTVAALTDYDGKPGGLRLPTCRAGADDRFADYSNTGSDVDLIAPGTCILSTYLGGGYATFSGTSMAAAHASGAMALYRSLSPPPPPCQKTVGCSLDWFDLIPPKEPLVNVGSF